MGIISEQATRVVEEAAREKSPLVWCDKSGEFAPLVEKLKQKPGAFPYPIFIFEGSFLELMLESRKTLEGKHPVSCVIYLKGFDEQDLRFTPLYEACKAGTSWAIGLGKIVREAGESNLSSEQIEYILGRENLDVEVAEKIADGMVNRPPEIDEAIALFGTEDDFLLSFLKGDEKITVPVETLKSHFDRVFGFTDEWILDWTGKDADDVTARKMSVRDLAEYVISYLMCTEFAGDLLEPPHDNRLKKLAAKPAEYHTRVQRFLTKMRRENSVLYTKWAEQIEHGLLEDEKEVPAAKLGVRDTFRFEADIMLGEALNALIAENWARGILLAVPRVSENEDADTAFLFWVKNTKGLELMWKWIDASSRLGSELEMAKDSSVKLENMTDAVSAYVSHDWKIDRLHREFQLINATMTTDIVRFPYGDFLRLRSSLLAQYRVWADASSRAWNAVCAREGFALQRDTAQRFFFERTIQPFLRAGKKTALVLVDAFRYELGEELVVMLGESTSGEKPIFAMLAELPTITAVGMNALMPVTRDGGLDPVFDKTGKKVLGFRTGERQVTSPDTREKSVAEYVEGRCEWMGLTPFLTAQKTELAKAVSADLLVISTQEIDTLGESGVDSIGIDYYQPVLARLKEVVEKLREGGFERIVVTADHGFLLGDETVQNNRASRLDSAERRHAFDIARSGENLVSVSFADLGWKTEDKNKALVFDSETHLLTSAKVRTFYHGGNSLQERVIPVIVLSGGAAPQMAPGLYQIKIKTLSQMLNVNRVRLTVEPCGPIDLFAPESVELRLSALVEKNEFSKVTIGEAEGCRFTGDTFEAPIGKSIIVSFKIDSMNGEKLRLSVNQVSSLLDVKNITTDDYFSTEGSGNTAAIPVQECRTDERWTFPTGCIPDEYETAIRLLLKHGSISETVIRNSLGNTQEASRKARRFAQRIADWAQYLPFKVIVRQTADGTEYRKV